MAEIRVGTSSWSDFASFYPPGLPGPQQIGFYAQRFAVVELNATFYRLMPARNFSAWASRTPPGFIFDVKPFQQLTWHDRTTPPTPEVAAEFAASLQPLRAAGKLGALHFQFPPWFVFSTANLDYLTGLRQTFADPLSVEFRHRSWLAAEALPTVRHTLEGADIALTVVDEPQVGSGSIPTVPIVTAPGLCIVRFHGRNTGLWYARVKRAADRFDYLYSTDELQAWVPTLAELAAQTAHLHVLFNNNAHDYAIDNALQLHRLLTAALGAAVVQPTGPDDGVTPTLPL
jgi:uncharacterized protein YecE (DUF72 family)